MAADVIGVLIPNRIEVLSGIDQETSQRVWLVSLFEANVELILNDRANQADAMADAFEASGAWDFPIVIRQ